MVKNNLYLGDILYQISRKIKRSKYNSSNFFFTKIVKWIYFWFWILWWVAIQTENWGPFSISFTWGSYILHSHHIDINQKYKYFPNGVTTLWNHRLHNWVSRTVAENTKSFWNENFCLARSKKKVYNELTGNLRLKL